MSRLTNGRLIDLWGGTVISWEICAGALFFVLLAILLNVGIGALCVPQSAVEYAASGVGLIVAAIATVVLAMNTTGMMLAWIGYNQNSSFKAGVLVAVLGLGWETLWMESLCRIPAVKVAFMRGTPTASPYEPCLLEYGNLSTIVTPRNDTRVYHLLEGPAGCGKTVLLKRACHDAGPGVIYVSVSEDPFNFYRVLAGAVNINFDEHDIDTYNATKRTLNVITQVAAQLRHERGKPIVLVIDNTASLARRDISTLELLQDFAKNGADEGTVTVVFSSNNAIVRTIFRGTTIPLHTACALDLSYQH